MHKSILIAVLVLALAAALLFTGGISQTSIYPTYAPAVDLEEATVYEVLDGDTIEVITRGIIEKVRYIGLDAPETWECYGSEATEYNRSLLTSGQRVWLERDVEDRDDDGRLLRYVFLDPDRSEMVNEMKLENGYAILMTIPPAYKYRRVFKRAAQKAWEQGAGLWSGCRIGGILSTDELEEHFAQYEGRIGTVEYEVAQVGTSGGVVFLNSSEDIYHHFTGVIYSDEVVCDFPESGIDLSALEGETVRVMGKLEWYEKGRHAKPEIIIETSWQIRLVR